MTELKQYALKEVATQDGRNGRNLWIVIYDKVYDVTTYKNKHPGGPELLEEYAGQDATRGFDEFGHSSDARHALKKFLIGELVEEDKMDRRRKRDVRFEETSGASNKRRFLAVLCGKCAT